MLMTSDLKLDPHNYILVASLQATTSLNTFFFFFYQVRSLQRHSVTTLNCETLTLFEHMRFTHKYIHLKLQFPHFYHWVTIKYIFLLAFNLMSKSTPYWHDWKHNQIICIHKTLPVLQQPNWPDKSSICRSNKNEVKIQSCPTRTLTWKESSSNHSVQPA